MSALTNRVGFDPFDIRDRPLFTVNPGVEADRAESVVDIILTCVRDRLSDAVQTGQAIQEDEAWLLAFQVGIVKALRNATGSAA